MAASYYLDNGKLARMKDDQFLTSVDDRYFHFHRKGLFMLRNMRPVVSGWSERHLICASGGNGQDGRITDCWKGIDGTDVGQSAGGYDGTSRFRIFAGMGCSGRSGRGSDAANGRYAGMGRGLRAASGLLTRKENCRW